MPRTRCGDGDRPTPSGAGTLVRVTVDGAASWGDDIVGINTFLTSKTRNLYNLYVIDPSEQQIRSYAASADGGGFPVKATNWLATPRDVSKIVSTYIDGDVFAVDGGGLERFVGGKSDGWNAARPEGHAPAAGADVLAGRLRGQLGGTGQVYAFDTTNGRLIALDKANGTYRAQYRLAGGLQDWSDLRGDGRRARGRHRPADADLDVARRPVPDRPDERRRRLAGRIASAPARARARPRRARTPSQPGSRPGSPDPGTDVLPLRDANPTLRTPLVTLA